MKQAVRFIPVSDLAQVLKHSLVTPARSASHAARAVPRASQLIATEESAAKEPAPVM